MELRGLGDVEKELKKNGGEVLAVSTESLDKIKAGRAKHPDINVVFASDENHTAIKTLHLVHDNFGDIIAAPANILVDSKGQVRWTHYADIVTDRPDPALILEQVKKLENAP